MLKSFLSMLLIYFLCQATLFAKKSHHISSNPAAVNIYTGTGAAQNYINEFFDIKKDYGIRFGGAWVGDANYLISGGIPDAQKWTFNSLLLLSLDLDTKKMGGWEGGMFGVEFLQFDGQETNQQAGSVQGYNSLPGPEPLNRSQLYQLWFRQAFFNDALIFRIGKSVPTDDFGNVIRPVQDGTQKQSIPAVSGLIFTPVFINTTSLGVMPGYYNSAYGVTINFAPIDEWYLSYGIYDGSVAQGVQTGIKMGPQFNGTYFTIAETGSSWLLGESELPGRIGVGAWYQHGEINGPPGINDDSATGFYLFGSQRLWYKSPNVDNSGISIYYQYGYNDSDALPMNQYVGAGLTAFALVPDRPGDSFGFGTALSWLNKNSFNRSSELMFQLYYQAQVIGSIYLEPVISYIPTPGAGQDLDPAWAGTVRAIVLF
ncbi:carbohydrate porin [Francisellaceae bacterium]|nr:carbohydrate porin [Francisellaceae bacterium]